MSTNHTHYPDWLANSWLFRRLFLLRKLFLTKRTFTHHGQMAEDVILRKYFPKKYKGFFVDVGCFHPVKYNNTYWFYKRGWRGINLDIDQIKIDGFNIVRPGDTNISVAVSNEEGTVTYYSNGFYTPTVTLSKDFTDDRTPDKLSQYVAKTTQACPLTAIIDDTKYKDRRIDILSVDVEGHDIHVLRSLDFERYAPKLIAVESQLDDFPGIQQSETYQFLMSKGYHFINWVGMTLIFQHPNASNT